jgi:hypothetical protein
MAGIYSKIDKFFSKVADTVKDNVLPALGKIGDFVDSDLFQKVSSYATPAIDSFIPGLGTGINSVIPYIAQAGKFARKYSNNKPSTNSVPKGIYLSKRPDNLHSRIQLKSLPPPEDDSTRPKSFVEETDEVE